LVVEVPVVEVLEVLGSIMLQQVNITEWQEAQVLPIL
jgi:hypothetical protein